MITTLNQYTVFDPIPNYPGAKGRGATFAPPVYPDKDSNVAFLTDELLKWLSVRKDEKLFCAPFLSESSSSLDCTGKV